MQSALYFCPKLIKFGFSRQISIEVSSVKFHENPSSGSRADTYEQTDGHDEIYQALFATLRTSLINRSCMSVANEML